MKSAILRIYAARPTTDGERVPVGAGLLVSDEFALTCAHVVYTALGLAAGTQPPQDAVITFDLPLLPTPAGTDGMFTASIEELIPRQPTGAGDVAVMRLSAPVQDAEPVRLVMARSFWNHKAGVFGLPAGRQGGVWHRGLLMAPQGSEQVQMNLDPASGGYVVSPGFSGSPVWDETLEAVVGMVVIAEKGTPPVSYLIPTEGLAAAWPRLRELTLRPSPFRSLKPFEESDQAIFHGRQQDAERIAEAVTRQRWTTLIGPTGSGKSSLARAGVVPLRRKAGEIPVIIRPAQGSSPLRALAAELVPLLEPRISGLDRLIKADELADRLTRDGLPDIVRVISELHGATRLLVVIDQFEELLLDEEGIVPLATLLSSRRVPADVRVLATLRADFMEAVLSHQILSQLVTNTFEDLLPMNRDQLDQAIAGPVETVPGVFFEDGLAEQILNDAGTAPGALPLLGFTLDRLWSTQARGMLSFQAYHHLGGVKGALAAYAEHAWADVPDADKPAARRLLPRLVRVPIGSEAPTRRVVPRAELGDDEWRVAQRLATTRLLAVNTTIDAEREGAPDLGDESVELAHEVLITAWPELAKRVADDNDFLTWHESLRHDVDRWVKAGRDRELLPTRPTLDAANRWLPEREQELSEPECDYLRLGTARQRRRTHTWRGIFATLTALMLIASGAAAFGLWERHTANAQRDQAIRNEKQAVFNQTSAEALQLSDSNTPLAAGLNLAAYHMNPTDIIASRLISMENTPLSEPLDAGSSAVTGLALSKDGHLMVTSGEHEDLRLWAVTSTGHARLEYSHRLAASHDTLDSAVLTPDGRLLAVACSGTSTFLLWNVADPAHPMDLGTPPGMGAASVDGLAFSPDGRLLASGGSDGRIRLWNVTDPAHPMSLGDAVMGSAGGFVRTVGFSPDGKLLATGGEDGTIRLWSLANAAKPQLLGQALAGGTDAVAGNKQGIGSTAVFSLAFSPDGRLLATGDADDAVQLWNITSPADPRPLGQASAAATDVVTSVAFSPDGQVLASAGYDGAIRLWDVSKPDSPQALGQPLTAGSGTVYSIAFGPNGTMLASGNQDGTVRLWTLSRTRVTGPAGPVDAVAFSPDKQILATGSADGTVRLWDVADLATPSPLGRPLTVGSGTPEVHSVAISPNGRLLAAGSHDGIALWDITDPARPVLLARNRNAVEFPVGSVAFSPSGGTLATTEVLGDYAVVSLWSLTGSAHLKLFAVGQVSGGGQPLSEESVTFSPNGRTLATSYTYGLIRLWNVPSSPNYEMQGISLTGDTSAVTSLAFAPNGRTLAAGNSDGTVQLWNVVSPSHPRTLGQNASPVASVAVSPDGQLLVAGRDNGTVSVWSLATASRSTKPRLTLTTDTNWVNAVAFSPDGTLATGSEDETVQLWNLQVNAAIGHVCSLAASDLTPLQWQVYIPQFPYQPPCPA